MDAHFSGRGDANAENATDYLSDSSDDELAMERIFERYGADDFEIIKYVRFLFGLSCEALLSSTLSFMFRASGLDQCNR